MNNLFKNMMEKDNLRFFVINALMIELIAVVLNIFAVTKMRFVEYIYLLLVVVALWIMHSYQNRPGVSK